MQAESLMPWLLAIPFQPFRIVLNSGRTYDVRHPDFIDVGEDSALYFHRDRPGTRQHYKWETFSLLLIDHIERLESPRKPGKRRTSRK